MNNEEKPVISYDPQTGERLYTGQETVVEEPKKKSHAGLIIGIIVGVLVFLGLCVFGILFATGLIFTSKTSSKPGIVNEEKTFYGESYEITYKYPWKESTGTLTSCEESKYLNYNNGDIVLLPLGSTPLDETSTADFSTSTGKFKLYNDFREYWGKKENISGGTGTFYTLKDNIYYASMNYINGSRQGKLYLIASEENNVLLSFSTQINIDKETADEKVLELFKNININTMYDDELAGYLDTMSNWNILLLIIYYI